MRIGLVELLLILLIAALTIGPGAALWVDRWLRRANRAGAAAARRRAAQEAQRAAEREAVLQRFQKLSIVFALAAAAALVWTLVLRPIETAPKAYTAPDLRPDTGAAQVDVSTDRKGIWDPGEYQGVDCIRAQDGLVYAAAWNGTPLKKRTSGLVRTDGGHNAAILSVEGELTGFAFDAGGDLWLTVLTPGGGTLCRARHDSWGAAVEQVVTQIDGAPLGALSAVETGPDGKVYFAAVSRQSAANGLDSALRTERLAHTGPWQPLHLACGRFRPWADCGRQGLPQQLQRPARLPRRACAGHRRHAPHRLPLGPFRLAGKPRGQHPVARDRPAAEPDHAGEPVLSVGRKHPCRSRFPRQ